MKTWKKYRKSALQEMRPYVPGEDLTGVSVAPKEIPGDGGMIARDNQGSRWYVSPEFMAENYEQATKRDAVYKLIDGEREYQDSLPNHSIEKDRNHHVADWLIFIRTHLNKAEYNVYQLQNNEALKEVRKIAALTVACMEYNDTKPRVPEGFIEPA